MMTSKQMVDANSAKESSENNWIYIAQLKAEEFKILSNMNNGDLFQDKSNIIIKEYLSEKTGWSIKAINYLSAEIEGDRASSNAAVAAGLAACTVNAEKSLITAIELARSGYIICSLFSILQVIVNEHLSRDDRLNALMVVIEQIVTNKYISIMQLNAVENHHEWLYAAKHAQFLTEVHCLLIELFQSQEKLCKLIKKIESLIDLANLNTALKLHKQEKSELDMAIERKILNKKLSTLYKKPVIRSIHHLACTGGTLISKCLASMHNVALISEVNPMNRFDSEFSPTNPLLLLERGHREFTKVEKIDIFKEQIKYAQRICQNDDVDLILRDHSHTDFHTGNRESNECPILDHLRDDYSLISVISVRHPLDSYLSLIIQGWHKQFQPNNLNEYCRRYIAFIEKYSSFPVVRYEDFCDDPTHTMKKICDILKISYNNNFLDIFGTHRLSGDSGRTGLEVIEKRPRRTVPKDIEEQSKSSECYIQLIERLGY